VKVLQLVSCRGWSSDAYWAARVTRELERLGHRVVLGCRRGTDAAVIERVRGEGVSRIDTFAFASGLAPAADAADVRRLVTMLADTDVVHVHRGKEHWLAVIANRLTARPRPVVRTRHIAQAVRPHAGNRWLYRRATALVVTVTEAIRAQYIVSGLLPPHRVVTLAGGVDVGTYRPFERGGDARAWLGDDPTVPLVGMVSGLRVMKGHATVIDAAARLAAAGVRPHFAIIGGGVLEPAIRDAIRRARLDGQFTIAGFVAGLPAIMASLDVALYVPLESDGMSRVVFEYLAAARPVIAARVGVVPEVLVDGEHAALVPAGDPAALAITIRRLLEDPPLRARLGTCGRRLVEARYSGARVARALLAEYARLVAA
jgi:glycosyltransferase involved in cell wall biosynthesis